jgi:hypothetical protein
LSVDSILEVIFYIPSRAQRRISKKLDKGLEHRKSTSELTKGLYKFERIRNGLESMVRCKVLLGLIIEIALYLFGFRNFFAKGKMNNPYHDNA